MKYISQLRRGSLAQWQAYEASEGHLKPLAGELVVEFDTINGKVVPRLKIGNGIDEFTQLEYISVDSFILPTKSTITLVGGLSSNAWEQDKYCEGDTIPTGCSVGSPIPNKYKQVVTVNNATITSNSKINLQPSPEQLLIFHEKDVAFTAVNENGAVTVYAVGVCPTNNHTIQVTVEEVVV